MEAGQTGVTSPLIIAAMASAFAEPVAIIKSLISDLEYDDVIEFLYMYDLEALITADNLPAVKELVISLIDALTDGQAQYSVTVGLTSYEG